MVVVNCEIVAEMMADRDMMPAVKAELPAFQAGNDFSKGVGILIKLFLLSGH